MLSIDRDQSGNPLPIVLYGCHRSPAAFLESFPRISAAELADALEQGHNRCVWSWPEDDAPFALADFELPHPTAVKIRLECDFARTFEQRFATVSLRQATNYSDRRAFSLFLCPRCGCSCKHIVFTWRWHCRRCSNLPYRRQRIGSKVAAYERLDALEKQLAGGRPKGMHHRTFEERMRELNELRAKLSGPRAEAPREYLLTLARDWMRWPSDTERRARWDEYASRRDRDRSANPVTAMPWLSDGPGEPWNL